MTEISEEAKALALELKINRDRIVGGYDELSKHPAEIIQSAFDAHDAKRDEEMNRLWEVANGMEKALRSADRAIKGREHTGFIYTAIATFEALKKEYGR